MSFRDDHDAALHRVAALEDEVERLREEKAKLEAAEPRPARPRRGLVMIGVLVAAFVAAGVSIVALRGGAAEPAPPVPAAPIDEAGVKELRGDVLGVCVESIDRTLALDATSTDPRGEARSVGAVKRLVAPCRTLITDARWLEAEDRLGNVISMIEVYYDGDPYQVDGYRSAPQLWAELERARAERDAAIDRIVPSYVP